ncbi:hypothetical protein B9W64_37625 [Streptomyces sp. CS159]|uniref:hypothetical protein n=1 Tax=Streptomyces sp. CS159 TaxID=1982762 RepID=UPI000B41F895|nr:hypothetical protein [Streptomyces sp. CS159]OVZ99516.1 hypothetical protein B9W64_37625 [Streptomyces sp. CS159]
MASITTSTYGTWCSRVNVYSNSPDDDVVAVIDGGSPEWRQALDETGALARMQADYRAAIDAALPADVALCGNEFIGPTEPEPGEFAGYPTDSAGCLDFAAMVEPIDLEEIIARHDPDA